MVGREHDVEIVDVQPDPDNGDHDPLEWGATWPRSKRAAVVVAALVLAGALFMVTSRPRDRHDEVRSTSSAPTVVPTGVARVLSTFSADALVEGAMGCDTTGPVTGGTVSGTIRNRLDHPVTILSVVVPAQRGVTVAGTAIGRGRMRGSTCPGVGELDRPAGYRMLPGTVWVAARLSREPRCGVQVLVSFAITYSDRGQVRRVELGALGSQYACLRPARR